MIRLVLVPVCSLWVGLAPVAGQQVPGAAVPAAGPAEVVARFDQALASLAAGDETPLFTRRYERIAPVVAATHDLASMARASLGASWKTVGEAQRARFSAAFAKVIGAAYAARFDGPAAFTAPHVAAAAAGADEARVECRRTGPGGAKADVHYLLRLAGGRWRIIDAVGAGIPGAAERRAEYRDILEREGAARLVARLEERAAITGATASQVIERLQSAFLAAMKGGKGLGYAGRTERLAPAVEETHDFAFIARFVVRRHWKHLDALQRRRFEDAFRRLSVATYASRFHAWGGESFAVTGERKARGGYVVVDSRLTKADGKKVGFVYQMHAVGGRWRIVNIVVDGVSDVATKQSEYRTIIGSKGFPALVEKIEAQIRRYREGTKD